MTAMATAGKKDEPGSATARIGIDAPQSQAMNENTNSNISASEDEEEDPYTDVSSMSEEEGGGGGDKLSPANFTFARSRSVSNGSRSDGQQSPLDLNLQSSTSTNDNDKSNDKDNGAINVNANDNANDPKIHLLHHNDSSSNAINSNANRGNNSSSHTGSVLQCVTLTTEQYSKPPSSPLGSVSVASNVSTSKTPAMPRFYDSEEEGAGGSLVFTGDASVSRTPSRDVLSPKAHGTNHNSNNNNANIHNPTNLFIRSSNSSEDGGSVVRVSMSPAREMPRPSGKREDDAPQLLPYQHRRKLSQEDLLQPTINPSIGVGPPPPPMPNAIDGASQMGVSPPTTGDGNKRPPLAFPPKQANLPPMMPNQQQQNQPQRQQPAPSASKFKVAQIPSFKGRGSPSGKNHARSDSEVSESNSNPDEGWKKMRKVKSAVANGTPKKNGSNKNSHSNSYTSPKTSPEKQVLSPTNAADRDSNNYSNNNNNNNNRPPRAPQSSQEVIDSFQGSNSTPREPPSSPRSGGYHIRIASQGSISSMDSCAGADSDINNNNSAAPLHHIGMQQQPVVGGQQGMPPLPNANQNYYNGGGTGGGGGYNQYGMQQQPQQPSQQPQGQYGMQQQHPQAHPRGDARGDPRQQQQQQQQQQQHSEQPQVNYNDILGHEVAHFLQGEQIATAVAKNMPPQPYPPPPQGPPPHHQWNPQHGPPPNQPGYGWNPQHGPPPGYNPYQMGMGYPPPGYPMPESQPPPTNYHPNVPWDRQRQHRERLPSVSEDDWDEMLNRDDVDGHGRGDGQDGGGYSNRRNNNNRQQRHGSFDNRHPQQAQSQQYQQYPQDNNMPPHGHYDQDPRMGNSNNTPYHLPPNRQGSGGHHDRRHSQSRRSSSDNRRSFGGGEDGFANEKSSLLSPTGIRTYESRDNRDMGGDQHHHDMYHRNSSGGVDNNNDRGWGVPPARHYGQGSSGTPRGDSKKKKSKRRRREKERRQKMYSSNTSSEEDEQLSGSFHRHGSKSKKSKGRRGHRKRRSQSALQDDSVSETYSESLMSSSLTDREKARDTKYNFFQRLAISTKLLICNLPLSSSAISFSIALLGIVWLKWAQEILPSCKEVNFHSSQCAFPEFPGCYFCDEYNPWYRAAMRFHTACDYIAGVSAMLFFAKATLCWRVFIDEMSSPTTAAPSGLIFMTMALSFVGKGDVGAILVFVASLLHLILVVWFIYMSLAYQTMSDPSWFANTIGIGLCAVKVWFYEPLAGHFLIAITLMLTFLFYPISLIRVALNDKMSATICWINMMGPAVSLYSLAIIMQPTFQQERPDISHFQTVQRSIYLPSMTCLFGLCIIGMISSVQGLVARWKQISREEFSPAHAAYSFPLLMHAMAVQSYRSSLDFFADADNQVSPAFKTALHAYWVILVISGTIVALLCIMMYLAFLPSWVDADRRDEIEPPAPNETSMCNSVTYGESLIQPYISPTILQANETGILIMAFDYQNGWSDLVRTRRIPAFGFEPMMSKRTFNRERNAFKLFMGGQDVIQEGDEEEGDDMCFENELEHAPTSPV